MERIGLVNEELFILLLGLRGSLNSQERQVPPSTGLEIQWIHVVYGEPSMTHDIHSTRHLRITIATYDIHSTRHLRITIATYDIHSARHVHITIATYDIHSTRHLHITTARYDITACNHYIPQTVFTFHSLCDKVWSITKHLLLGCM